VDAAGAAGTHMTEDDTSTCALGEEYRRVDNIYY